MTILSNMTPAQRAEFLAAGDTSGLLTKDQATAGTGVKADGLVGSAAAQVRGGPLTNGVWVKLPAIYRILLGGTGAVSIDTRARDGTVSAGVASYSPTGPAEDYPYFDNAYEVRATLTDTATAEIV